MQLMKGGGILIRVSCYLQATVIDKSLSGTWTASKPLKGITTTRTSGLLMKMAYCALVSARQDWR